MTRLRARGRVSVDLVTGTPASPASRGSAQQARRVLSQPVRSGERCVPPAPLFRRPTDSTLDKTRRPSPETDPVSLVGDAVLDALEQIDLPAYVVDRKGTLRWANKAVSRLIGDRVGHSFLSFVSPDTRQRFKAQLARKLVGAEATAYTLTVFDPAGLPAHLRVHSAPLRRIDQEIVGVFGLALPIEAKRGESSEKGASEAQLTPRQAEVLRLLGEGLSTEAIASRLGVAVETARNHIRAVLRGLGVHSRLEAVVEGRERGLLDE
jgi:PAS domain S-box-containing protein